MIALVVLSTSALPLAERLATGLKAASVHRVQKIEEIAGLFAAGIPIVGLCAAGILIRAVAPLLGDKRQEPPVVAVAEDGSAVVPLLGGHRGANALARRIAALTGGTAAVTTASDVRLGLAFDEPPPGWRVGTPEQVKDLSAALLRGGKVRLVDEVGLGDWLRDLPEGDAAPHLIRVTARQADGFLLHPPVLAVGVGCERGCAAEELIALVRRSLAEAGGAAGAGGRGL
jgi:cobalt-precorrin 5A hydrolase/precorrin-3B C17-methyltransferase